MLLHVEKNAFIGQRGAIVADHVNAGLLRDLGALRALVNREDAGVRMDFPELVLRLLDHGERVVAHRADCRWFDIGRPDDYAAAQAVFTADPASFS